MRERKFWRIYIILVNSHVALYEKRYMKEAERKAAEKVLDKKVKESSNIEMTSQPQEKGTKQHGKSSTSVTEQDWMCFYWVVTAMEALRMKMRASMMLLVKWQTVR
ncbi:uncharacterized protein LOC120165022 [Hibiscus syriacus]|uniref:uncharacterized protein LOC120165022 n=1 Tax=Hibiscus syriacus TaxID=106335 RepID=UPI001923F252|nr:uncharacterized protein LOC120165022 [Hibiscus syriacus]